MSSTSENNSSPIKVITPQEGGSASSKDLTMYALEDGRQVSTRDRVVPAVKKITSHRPTDEDVFNAKTGLPNHKFIRDHFAQEGRLTASQLSKILMMATRVLFEEPNVLEVPSPVTVCGDIHGQYFDLLKLFEVGGDPTDGKTKYLFLGDYVDRGVYSLECLIYLYSLKLNFKDSIWLLRGNHECKHLTSYFTFKNEILHKYNAKIYDECCQSFNALPLAAIMNGQYFCVHGGISPHLKTIDDIRKLERFNEIPSGGLMCDLVWADPIEDYDEENADDDDKLFIPNEVRGCSYAFTHKAACQFLHNNGLLCIIRAHEAQDAGYRMYKNNDALGFPSLLTLFSAPNYCDTYQNKAAILKFENNVMNIRQFNFTPHPYWLPDFMDVFTWSLPFVGEKVTELLVSILNICTEEELEEPLKPAEISKAVKEGKSIANTKKTTEPVTGVTTTTTTTSPMAKRSILDDEHKRRALRNKILAIAKVSRMYSVLKEDSEKVKHLKAMNAGVLPRGALAHGSEGLDETLTAFEKARKQDLINEKLPPNLNEAKLENKIFYQEMLKKAATAKQNSTDKNTHASDIPK
ncbi:calcineurin catalytic subunit A NDAI_0J02460 [Naumovozyma dairenensis CBS 421]|uniref:Serine/threonine-protein phosphatase n=1 Tax=Naumovozyma dairenensis (strain ATCC 10597 / BCRC 20456 / CBS 421 / NBRC 0211 / NRRL Y-12639) TaxID=1071378 RepID=G0WH60_NAUDC|nr:hypothetical protein NDAI_0J02460 [Naumovozyma dairenensis CBS 421]CCD27138.1 hypothetical protein NDAI_0J02460 [Naumovozyma dairenensis CBS 421]